MPEDSRVPIILEMPFLATARAMIDVFNKKITLRVGDDEVIFDVDQSTKRPTTEDDECYGIDDLDDTINAEAQELLENKEPDSFLSRGLEKLIDQSDLECCESAVAIKMMVLIQNTQYGVSTLLIRRFFQIPIALEDQEKTTFTCPYGTFAYRRMPFGLWAESLAAAHLSRLENPDLGTFMEEEITDEFLNEHLMILKAELNNDEPCYADYYAFKLCSNNVMRRCVAGNEILEILAHCHSGPTRGHHSASITGRKVYESRFYWPSIFKDAKDYVMRYDACQRSGYISSRNEMPQNNIQTEVTNRAIKCILERSIGYNPKNWSEKLDDALWAFITATRRLLDAPPSDWFMEKPVTYLLRGDKDFKAGDKVLLFNSRFKMHPGKLKSKCYDPNVVKTVHPYGTVEIIDKNRINFKVNGKRLKKYHDGHINSEEKEVVELDDDTTVLYKVEDIATYLVEYVKEDDWEVDRYGNANLAIMEYLVNISKRRAFWSLNEDILKITILKTNTPYPSRKIRRIHACTHQRPQRNKAQYAVSREDQYAVLEIWNEYNILEDIKRGSYSKKSPIRRIQSLDTPYRIDFLTL
ncbi:DNA-directed DNA polymerase [Tanacetum coccineum]